MIRWDVDSRIKQGPGELLSGPHVVRVSTFDELGLRSFRHQLRRSVESGQDYVLVVCDSYGGDCYALFAMYDELDAARQAGRRIVTVAVGKAMSAGTDLVASGDKDLRFAGPSATLLVHDNADGLGFGKAHDLQANADEVARVNDLSFEIFDRNCGKPKGHFRKLLGKRRHADWYMGAKEAKRHGIVDHVGLPVMVVRVGVSFEIRLPKGGGR